MFDFYRFINSVSNMVFSYKLDNGVEFISWNIAAGIWFFRVVSPFVQQMRDEAGDKGHILSIPLLTQRSPLPGRYIPCSAITSWRLNTNFNYLSTNCLKFEYLYYYMNYKVNKHVWHSFNFIYVSLAFLLWLCLIHPVFYRVQ